MIKIYINRYNYIYIMISVINKIKKNGVPDNLSILELEKIITFASNKYYNTNKPVMSDNDFDKLILMLKLKNPDSQVLTMVGSNIKSTNKVKLDYWLGSMNKITTLDSKFLNWVNKYKQPYNISDKLDGVSALLIYDKYKNIKLYTRGNGEYGQDITLLLKYIKLPDNVIEYCLKHNIIGDKNIIALRGELIIKKAIFNDKWSKDFKNIRNTVSGVVNSKKINKDLAKDIDLVLYEIIEPNYDINTQIKYLNNMGFNVVHNYNVNNLSFDSLSDILNNLRNESIYDIDGIIIITTQPYIRNNSGNPDYAFAYKNISEIGITIVSNISWNISKDGYVIPTIILEPIHIGGVVIKRVTGNNAKFIVDNNIGIGSKVEIIRSGDVIPKINKIITKGTVILPSGKWHWNDTQVDIVMDNLDNKDILIKNIYFFFSTLKTKGLGLKVIEKMVSHDINSIKDILSIKDKDLMSIPNFGEKSIQNIITNIKKSTTNINLATLMAASNKLGRGIGILKINDIIKIYPNILNDYKKWNKSEFIDKITHINGWDLLTAKLFVNNFNKFIDFYDEIKKFITLSESNNVITQGKLLGYNIVLSGFRDDKLTLLIESLGGKISDKLNSQVNMLIIKNKDMLISPTDKILKAQKIKIDILTIDDFHTKFNIQS